MKPGELVEVVRFFGELGVEYLQIPSIPDGSQEKNPGRPDRMAEIQREVQSCRKCGLFKTRNRCVPGSGPLEPDIMFVGEAPGGEEDRRGIPFIGRAGQLLNRLIDRMGYRRDQLYITNILKCRPPGNRNPSPEEVKACLPYLTRQIDIINPRVIVCLGKIALNSLLGTNHSIMKEHGREFSYRGRPLIPTIHPSYILFRSRDGKEAVSRAKWIMWEDIRKAVSLGRQR